MKKSLVSIMLILLCAFIVLPCEAATITEPGNSDDHGVYGTVVSEVEHVYRSLITDGSGQVSTASGVAIEASGVPEGARMLVVREITSNDSEAWDWVTSRMKNISDKIIPYDIYFEDESGNRMSPDVNAELSVDCTDAISNPSVYALSYDGQTKKLENRIVSGRITATVNTGEYYVITDTVKDDEKAPQTGNDDSIEIMLILFIVSGGFLVFVVRRRLSEYISKSSN